MSRPLLRGALALIGSMVLVGALLSVSRANSGCGPVFTDPAGDAYLVDSAFAGTPLSESDLDIVAGTFSAKDGVFSAMLKIADLAEDGPGIALGDAFELRFTVAAKAVALTVSRDFSAAASTRASGTVAGAAITFPLAVVNDHNADVIGASMSSGDLEKAVGVELDGQAFSVMSAAGKAVYGASAVLTTDVQYDGATAPATAAYAFGADCSFPAAATMPAPTSSSSAPSAEPTADPSPAPSRSASSAPTAGPSPSVRGQPVVFDQPRAGCRSIVDEEGDARPQIAAGQSTGNSSDLDVTGVAFKTTAETLQAFVLVKQLTAGPGVPYNGHRFEVGFTHAGTNVLISGDSTGAATLSAGGTASTVAKPQANFDTQRSNVVFTLKRAELELATAELRTGTILTGTFAGSSATSAVGGPFPADTAQAANPVDQVYTVGDLTCFQPPAAHLRVTGPATVQYGDVLRLSLALTDAAGGALAARPVTVQVKGRLSSVTTDAAGRASVGLTIASAAGAIEAVGSYPGDELAGPAAGRLPVTIVAERTVLSAAVSGGAVTATLRDDDGKAVGGQPVMFTDGTVKRTAKTSPQGVARTTGWRKGSYVTVSFPGNAKAYSAAKAVKRRI